VALPSVVVGLMIDTSRAFRFPSELIKLVRAVYEASDVDETRWIEWKSRLDLTGNNVVHHLVRQILGCANREPAVAERWAGGYAYILIGVSPGQLYGVQAVDPEQVVSKIRPYVGSEIVWTPEYVSVDGVDVLVVIIDPPQNGDMIRTLRKALQPYEAGTVLTRRPGQVERADPDEMIMLQKRLMAGPTQVGVSVILRRRWNERQTALQLSRNTRLRLGKRVWRFWARSLPRFKGLTL
jgi:hypothetical protein